MEIRISDSALSWFKNEIGVGTGDKVKFYTQIYGSSPVQPGYSLAFTIEEPIHVGVGTEEQGILFYIEHSDLWYFEGHDLFIDYDEKMDELRYCYVKGEGILT